MVDNKELLLRNLFSNLSIEVQMVGYTKCPKDWREIDYIPEFNKIYYILDGEGWLKIGNDEYFPKPGQLFIMPADIQQSYSFISGDTFLKYWCHFTAKTNGMNLFDIVKVPIHVDIPEDSPLNFLFKELLRSYEEDSLYSVFYTKGIMYQILAWYFENIPIEDWDLSYYSTTREILEVLTYIEENLSDNITIEELARIVHYHPNYFIRFFKDHMGCSPIAYINRMRLNRAKTLLRTTSFSIKEITDMTGFNDPGYFSRTFKRDVGLSPVEYRDIK